MNHIDASTVGTAHDDGTVTITNRLPARLRCPKCGAEDGESWVTQQAPRLSISIAPFSGEYCLTCYARWVAENIPKLEPFMPSSEASGVPKTPDAGEDR